MMQARFTESQRLALRCSETGSLSRVLRDDLEVTTTLAPGSDLRTIIDEGSVKKFEAMLRTLASKGRLSGWEVTASCRTHPCDLTWTGVAIEGELLLAAAPHGVSGLQLLDDFPELDASERSALTAALEEQRQGFDASMKRDTRLYEELSRLNNDLINRERELSQKSAALERISAEKGRVLAVVAHDLRNPLSVISSYAELLKLEDTISGEQLMWVDEILRAARFITELVDDVLDTSSLESGRTELHLQTLNLVEVARRATTINQVRGGQKAIVIELVAEVETVEVRADEIKLRQILNNLISNAIKFSNRGTTVLVRVARRGDFAILEVQDQGIGIDPAHISRIFEPFNSLESAGTEGEKSTGLGLAIVKQLADLHGARVEVESERGKGSLFRIRFRTVNP